MGLSRILVAQEIGIPEDLLAKYEAGKISPPVCLIYQMLEIYRADLSCLLPYCCNSIMALKSRLGSKSKILSSKQFR